MPLRIIPERSEAPEHDVQSARAKGWDVFDDDPARARFLDDAEVFEPQAGTLPAKAGAFSGDGNVLAGKTAADQIDGHAMLCQGPGAKSTNVVMDWHPWPVLRQHAPAERFDLAEHRRLHAGTLQPEREAADAAEQVKHPHGALPIRTAFVQPQ